MDTSTGMEVEIRTLPVFLQTPLFVSSSSKDALRCFDSSGFFGINGMTVLIGAGLLLPTTRT